MSDTFMISNFCHRTWNLSYEKSQEKGAVKNGKMMWNDDMWDMSVDLTLGNYMFCYDYKFQILINKQYMSHALIEIVLVKHSRINIEAYNKVQKKTVFAVPTTYKELLDQEDAIKKVEEMGVVSSYISSLKELQAERAKIVAIPGCQLNEQW